MNRIAWFLYFMLLPVTVQAFSTHDYWVPQAKTLDAGEIKFDLQQQFNIDKSSPTTAYHHSLWGMSMGLFQWGRLHAEGGFDWREPTTTTTAAALSVHGRVVFNDVKEDGWGIAVGTDQLGFHPGQNDYNINHLIFQNILGEEWEMAFGGFAANSRYLGTDDKGMFAGLWHSIQTGHGNMGVEWMSGSSELGYFVPGIKVEVRDGVIGYIAYGFANRRNVVKDWLLMRISILF